MISFKPSCCVFQESRSYLSAPLHPFVILRKDLKICILAEFIIFSRKGLTKWNCAKANVRNVINKNLCPSFVADTKKIIGKNRK
jgi:hypothetical protein